MAKEDFCFTYYDGDAARDTTHMNRLDRGAYHDLILAQRKFGHLTFDQIKKVLGRDFNECWPAIELIMKTDSDGKYYIEWLDNSIKRMRKHSTKQSENVSKRYQNSTKSIPNATKTVPLENGDGNGDGNGIEKKVDLGKPENHFGETLEDDLKLAFDDIYLETLRMNWRRDDFDFQLKAFVEKVRGSPNHYSSHGSEGLRLAFNRQLRESTPPKTTHKDIIAERKRKAKQL